MFRHGFNIEMFISDYYQNKLLACKPMKKAELVRTKNKRINKELAERCYLETLLRALYSNKKES